jgi:hypothetical protein
VSGGYTSHTVMTLTKTVRTELRSWVESKKKMSQPERTALQARRTALQRDIYKFTVAQGEYMPHIKWARSHNDFTFITIHGIPPAGNLVYIAGAGLMEHPSTTGPTTTAAARQSASSISALGGATTADAPAERSSKKRKRRGPKKKRSRTTADDPTNNLMAVERAEDIRLWLPSDLPAFVLDRVCSPAAVQAELAVLQAELQDTLVSIRKYRRLYCVLRSNFRGTYSKKTTGAMTRKRSELAAVGVKLEVNKIRYQHAWRSSQRLDPGGVWSQTYLKLETSDIRGPNPQDDLADAQVNSAQSRPNGVGQYVQSWIWRANLSSTDEPVDQVRVQWAKTRANAERWKEQLQLVMEEMRRTVASFAWISSSWSDRVGARQATVPPRLGEALDAYAIRQARMFSQRRRTFADTWIPSLIDASPARSHMRCTSTSYVNVLPLELVTRAVATEAANRASLKAATSSLPSIMDREGNQRSYLPADTDNLDVCKAVEDGDIGTWDVPAPQSSVPADMHVRDDESDEEQDEDGQSSSESASGDGSGSGSDDE